MTRLSWNQCPIYLGFRCTSTLYLTGNEQVWRENYLLSYFLSSESGYRGSIFIFIWYRNNMPIDFCSGYPSAQDAAWICCSHFVGTSCEGPPNDTQCSMGFLFIPDTRSGWVSRQHRDSAWISCPLFPRSPVVGSPISPGLSIDSMLTVSVPSVWPSGQLGTWKAFLVHSLWCISAGSPISTGPSTNFRFTISWYTSGWASHQHKDSVCLSCSLSLGTPRGWVFTEL